MKKQLLLILMLWFAGFLNQILHSQTDTIPLSLTKKYFNGDLKNYKSYFANEIIDQDVDPKKISKKAILNYESILMNPEKSIIAVSVEEKDNYTDCYVYWVNEKGWKLQSIQSLRMPAMFQIMFSQFKYLDDNEIKLKYNEILKSTQESDSSLTEAEVLIQVGSIEDFEAKIKSMKQTILPDKELIAHFNKNKVKFNNLLEEIRKDNPDKEKKYQFNYNSTYKKAMQEITISSITNMENPQIISFVIGGMGKNYVGYFYCENPSDLPEISPKNFIIIRPLGNGWYLYKTS